MPYPYTIQDLLCGIGQTTASPNGGVWDKLSQRAESLAAGKGVQWIADAVLNLSNSYPIQGLQRTTTTPVQLNNGQYVYNFSEWVNAGDIPTFGTTNNPKLIPSFFMYYEIPLNQPTGYNPGVGLTFKSIDSLELMFGTPGTPAFWSRYQNQIYIAPQPDANYYSYMRYQIQHPFSNPPALTDVILMDDDWREIIEYAGAYRGANNLRMLDYGQMYKNLLYGDPAKKGDLGLITALVSSLENDTVSNMGTRQIRPVMRMW